MTLDFWGLGLQAVNVLILIWLMSRVFWRPVAAAIVARQEASRALLDKAAAAQAAVDAALAEATVGRKNTDAARKDVLDAAHLEAEAATKATLADAEARADDLHANALAAIEKERIAAEKDNAAHASALALQIATKLLERLDGPAVQSAFLALLVEAIAKLPQAERSAIAATPEGVEIVLPTAVGPDGTAIKTAVQKVLGGAPELRFVTDGALIAGIELRTAHFALHNSWQADLAQIAKAVHDAG